jgi:hypothetical protein
MLFITAEEEPYVHCTVCKERFKVLYPSILYFRTFTWLRFKVEGVILLRTSHSFLRVRVRARCSRCVGIAAREGVTGAGAKLSPARGCRCVCA